MTGTKHSPARAIAKSLMLVSVAWTGGATDAICYGGLGHVFAANMTGHTVLVALSLSGAAGLSIARSCIALAAFLFGVVVGAWSAKVRGWQPKQNSQLDFGGRDRGRHSDWICRRLVRLCHRAPEGQIAILIGLSGMAMGIQSAAVRSLEAAGHCNDVYHRAIHPTNFSLVQRVSNPTIEDRLPKLNCSVATSRQPIRLGLPIAVLLHLRGWRDCRRDGRSSECQRLHR